MGGEGQEWAKTEQHILELRSLLKDGGTRPSNNLQFIDSQPFSEVSGNYSSGLICSINISS